MIVVRDHLNPTLMELEENVKFRFPGFGPVLGHFRFETDAQLHADFRILSRANQWLRIPLSEPCLNNGRVGRWDELAQ